MYVFCLALRLPEKTEEKIFLAAWAFCVAGLVFTAILQLLDEVQAHREQEELEAKESDLENAKSSTAISDSGSDRDSGSEKDSGSDKDSDCPKGFQTSEGEKALLSRNGSVSLPNFLGPRVSLMLKILWAIYFLIYVWNLALPLYLLLRIRYTSMDLGNTGTL